jgi:hypothetical protein
VVQRKFDPMKPDTRHGMKGVPYAGKNRLARIAKFQAAQRKKQAKRKGKK